MRRELYELFEEICPDFEEYHFLKTDLYKGQVIGGFNLYYKKGVDDKGRNDNRQEEYKKI